MQVIELGMSSYNNKTGKYLPCSTLAVVKVIIYKE